MLLNEETAKLKKSKLFPVDFKMYFVNICIHRFHRKSASWYFRDISLNLVIQLSSKKRTPAGLECWNNSSSEPLIASSLLENMRRTKNLNKIKSVTEPNGGGAYFSLTC